MPKGDPGMIRTLENSLKQRRRRSKIKFMCNDYHDN